MSKLALIPPPIRISSFMSATLLIGVRLVYVIWFVSDVTLGLYIPRYFYDDYTYDYWWSLFSKNPSTVFKRPPNTGAGGMSTSTNGDTLDDYDTADGYDGSDLYGTAMGKGNNATTTPSPSPNPAPAPDLGVIKGDNDFSYEQPEPLTTDPPDDRINGAISYNGQEIYKDNSCWWYNIGSVSKKNKKRRKHCWDAADKLHQAGFQDGKSQLCPRIDGADCFEFIDKKHPGRCYAKVTMNDGKKKYVLLLSCVDDLNKSNAQPQNGNAQIPNQNGANQNQAQGNPVPNNGG